MDDSDEARARLGAAMIDAIVELPDGDDEGPAWTHQALVEPNLALGDVAEIRLVQDMLRLHGEIARAMEACAGRELPEAAKKQVQIAAKLTGELIATIKALVAYRGELLPKIKINPALVVGQRAKRQALLEPAAGTAQAELVLRIEDLRNDWERMIGHLKRQQVDVAQALADPAFDWRRRGAGLPIAAANDLDAWRDLEVLALHQLMRIDRDWSKIVCSDLRTRLVYEAPSAPKALARTEPQSAVRYPLARGVH